MAKKGTKKSNGNEAGLGEEIAGMLDQAVETCLISERSLKALLKEDDKLKGEIDTSVAELREAIGNKVEKSHLNKKAYAKAKAFHRYKSNEALKRDLLDFFAYLKFMGVLDRVQAVGDLPLGEAEGEEETDQQSGNVVHMEAPSQQMQ